MMMILNVDIVVFIVTLPNTFGIRSWNSAFQVFGIAWYILSYTFLLHMVLLIDIFYLLLYKSAMTKSP